MKAIKMTTVSVTLWLISTLPIWAEQGASCELWCTWLGNDPDQGYHCVWHPGSRPASQCRLITTPSGFRFCRWEGICHQP